MHEENRPMTAYEPSLKASNPSMSISDDLDKLDEYVNILQEELNRLGERVNPVLRDSDTKGETPHKDFVDSRSVVSNRLRNLGVKISDSINVVRELQTRVDL